VLAAAIFTFTLGRLTNLPSGGLPYVVFVYGGFVLWIYLSQSVNEAARSLVDNQSLVSKIYFPRILAPLAGVLPYLLDLALSRPLVLALMLAHGLVPGPQVVLLPVCVVSAAAFAFGVGTFLAAVNVKYRDVRQALPFLIQTWLFASPVLYPSSLVHGTLRWFYSLNPIVGLLDLFRWSLLNGPAPRVEDLLSLFVGVAMLVLGIAYFQRAERRFADVI
jgi:lipopolysaccharide transport system permease protein